jgi:anaerobic dimethyl sulfoxide reductase subunit C (anchor subunit)
MRARPGENETSLVVFTVLAQAAAGITLVAAFARRPSDGFPIAALLLLAVGGAAAAMHLGRIGHARLALSHLRSSWLSREAALTGLFALSLVAAAAFPGVRELRIAAAVAGLGLVGAIAGVYLVRTVPPWNTWMTPVGFYLTAILLGTTFGGAAWGMKIRESGLMRAAAVAAALQVILVLVHHRRFGRPEQRDLVTARIALALAGVASMLTFTHWAAAVACVLFAASELVGRQLFYASHRRVGL